MPATETTAAPGSSRSERIAAVVAHAVDALDGSANALLWLRTPNRALGGAAPLHLLDSGEAGVQQVDELLTGIEHGMFS